MQAGPAGRVALDSTPSRERPVLVVHRTDGRQAHGGAGSYVSELTGVEGYSALLRSIDTYDFVSVRGFVFPGSMPACPDPIEAPLE